MLHIAGGNKPENYNNVKQQTPTKSMTVRNDQLLEMFYEGIREGQNHTGTMRIVPIGEITLLVGFENCIYAHRAENAVVTKYTGWRNEDVSSTTVRHIEAIEASVTKDNRPQILSWDEGLIKPDGVMEIEDLAMLDNEPLN